MQFPKQRQELIETLRALSDRNYQESAWIKKESPDRIVYDCLDYAIHFLFDDTSLAEDPERLIGYILQDTREVVLIRGVTSAIDRLLDELGTDRTDAEYLASPLWNDVIEAAKKAYKTLDSRPIAVIH